MHLERIRLLPVCIFTILLGAGCASDDLVVTHSESGVPKTELVTTQSRFKVSSPAFKEGGAIPETYTCRGHDFSPPIAVSGAPEGTMSYALIMEDRDKPTGAYVHWLLYDIPVQSTFYAEGDVPPGTVGMGTGGNAGYEGPCPPQGETHNYRIEVLAVDITLGLPGGLTKEELIKELGDHILDRAHLIGSFVH